MNDNHGSSETRGRPSRIQKPSPGSLGAALSSTHGTGSSHKARLVPSSDIRRPASTHSTGSRPATPQRHLSPSVDLGPDAIRIRILPSVRDRKIWIEGQIEYWTALAAEGERRVYKSHEVINNNTEVILNFQPKTLLGQLDEAVDLDGYLGTQKAQESKNQVPTSSEVNTKEGKAKESPSSLNRDSQMSDLNSGHGEGSTANFPAPAPEARGFSSQNSSPSRPSFSDHKQPTVAGARSEFKIPGRPRKFPVRIAPLPTSSDTPGPPHVPPTVVVKSEDVSDSQSSSQIIQSTLSKTAKNDILPPSNSPAVSGEAIRPPAGRNSSTKMTITTPLSSSITVKREQSPPEYSNLRKKIRLLEKYPNSASSSRSSDETFGSSSSSGSRSGPGPSMREYRPSPTAASAQASLSQTSSPHDWKADAGGGSFGPSRSDLSLPVTRPTPPPRYPAPTPMSSVHPSPSINASKGADVMTLFEVTNIRPVFIPDPSAPPQTDATANTGHLVITPSYAITLSSDRGIHYSSRLPPRAPIPLPEDILARDEAFGSINGACVISAPFDDQVVVISSGRRTQVSIIKHSLPPVRLLSWFE